MSQIIYTAEGPLRIVQQSSIPGRALVEPVKYNANGIVRCGRAYWTDLPR